MDCLKINKTVRTKIIAQPFTATTIFCTLFMKHGDRKEFMDSVLNRLNRSRSFKRLGGNGCFVMKEFLSSFDGSCGCHASKVAF